MGMARRTISVDELDGFELDNNGQLYWRGKGVLLEQKISLRPFELFLVGLASVSTAIAAIWPIGLHFGWW
jgi:hypothetical protein